MSAIWVPVRTTTPDAAAQELAALQAHLQEHYPTFKPLGEDEARDTVYACLLQARPAVWANTGSDAKPRYLLAARPAAGASAPHRVLYGRVKTRRDIDLGPGILARVAKPGQVPDWHLEALGLCRVAKVAGTGNARVEPITDARHMVLAMQALRLLDDDLQGY